MEETALATISVARDIGAVMREAENIANTLNQLAVKAKLFTKIGDSKHLRIEGWGMVGAAFQVVAQIENVEDIDFGNGVWGFRASAVAVHTPTGRVVSRAFAMCLNDEERWGARPQYEYVDGQRTKTGVVATPRQQLMSMAQTRASSKALSLAFRWISVVGGFSGTPAEEMDDDGGKQPKSAPSQPKRTEAPTGAVISEAQSKRMYAIAVGKAKLDNPRFKLFLKQHGFAASSEVTRDKYDEMIDELEGGGAKTAPQEALISAEQREGLVEAAEECAWSPKELEGLLGRYKVGRVDHLPSAQFGAFLADVKKGPQ